jgi:GNAT superfamily N-acetyltransferase
MRVRQAIRSSDLGLAQRLEAAEAANGFAMAGAFAGGEARAFLGGCALFAGPGSPVSHAVGIGMNGAVSAAEFDELEEFFRSRGAACAIDLCPMCDLTVLEQVQRRGYRIAEFNNLMVRGVVYSDRWLEAAGAAQTSDHATWSRIVACGFSGLEEPPPEMLGTMGSLETFGEMFVVGEDAGAAMSERHGVALLYGDATLTAARGRGAQGALIRARLARAAEWNCQWAMACVVPGTGSHRNYERAGFQLAYMRVNVMREFDD